MPKVTGPCFSLSASKSLKKAITFQKRPSGSSVQIYRDPKETAPTSKQTNQRELFSNAVAAWNALDQIEKDVYNDLKHPPSMTGYNRFIAGFLIEAEEAEVLDTGFKNPDNPESCYYDMSNPLSSIGCNGIYGSLFVSVGNIKREGYYNYNFNIPAGAVIKGIEVNVKGYGRFQSCECAVKMGSPGCQNYSDAKEDTLPLGLPAGEITLGGAADLWGRAWSASDFSNANFRGILMTSPKVGDRASIYIDCHRIKVYYTA